MFLPSGTTIARIQSFAESAAFLTAQFLKASAAPEDTLAGWSLEDRDPQVIESMLPFFGALYQHYFRVKTDGWEHVPSSGNMLLIGSHNGGWSAPDTVMMAYDWFRRFGYERPTYALMEPRTWQAFPPLGRLAAQVGALRATPQMAHAVLEHQANLLIYPGGIQDVFRPHALRHRICFNGNQGFVKLALQAEVPIVPLISHGAHDTLLVLADIYPQMQKLHQQGMPWLFGIDPGVFPVYLGLPWGIGIGPLPNIPLPIPLHTRVCPPIYFERYGEEAARDRDYVEACYKLVVQTMQQALDRLVQEKTQPA